MKYAWHIIALLYLVIGSFFAWEYLQTRRFVHVQSANPNWRSLYEAMDTRTGVVCNGGPKLKELKVETPTPDNPLNALPDNAESILQRMQAASNQTSSPYEEEKYCLDLK